MYPHLFRIVLGIGVCSLTGCGPPTADVSGKVTYNGKSLDAEGGHITFVGPDGRQVSAPIAPDGAYRATGVVAGANRVVVYYQNPESNPTPGGKAPKSTSLLRFLPTKYADQTTSGLTVNVAPGSVYDVDLKGPALTDQAPK
jgi:hypothetical protein